MTWSSKSVSDETFSAYQIARIAKHADEETLGTNVISLDVKQDLEFVKFVSPQVGWTGNHYGVLYVTEDGGKSWQPRTLKVRESDDGVYYTSFHFASNLSGWAIAQHYNKPGEDICTREGSLLRTNDRGLTWQAQFRMSCVELLTVTFAGENEGWVLGHQFIQQEDITTGKFLVMHTCDGGSTWIDVSAEPNRLMANLAGRVLESPQSIVATGKGSASLITVNGYLLDTADGGKRWNRSGSLALYGLLPNATATEDHSLAITGGLDGGHGTAGMVAQRNKHGRWIGSWFNGFYLRDAIFLSSTDLIVSGSFLAENAQPQRPSRRDGVILHSINGGLDWKPVYRSSEFESVNALDQGQQRTIWAATQRGHLIQITLR